MKKCIACSRDLQDDWNDCPDCKAGQIPRLCKTCGKVMPRRAKRCNSCSTYRGKWMRHLPIVVQVAQILGGVILVGSAIYSVLGVLFPDYESHTHFLLARGDESSVAIKVWNTGKKPSELIGYRLQFDKLPDIKARLVLSPDDTRDARNIIESAKPAVIHLNVDPGRELTGGGEIRALTGWEDTQRMTLFVDVRESSDGPDQFHVLKHQFRSDRVLPFVINAWSIRRTAE